MPDYGIRVSKDNIDVKTGNDVDMIMTSKYPVLKGTISGSGSTTLLSGVPKIITVAHNLGHIPFAMAYVKLTGPVVLLPTGEFIEMPIPFVSTAIEADGYFFYMDSTNLKLDLFWQDLTATNPSITVDYVYYIFLDKGKL